MTHNGIAPGFSIALLALAALWPGCATKGSFTGSSEIRATREEPGPSGTAPAKADQGAAAVAAKAIGRPCVPEDGWLPPSREPGIIATETPEGDTRFEIFPTPPEAVDDVTQLGPGVGWCDLDGKYGGMGYWTQTCKLDSDCPNGSGCNENETGNVGYCRKICHSDAECVLPHWGGSATCLPSMPNRGPICIYFQPPANARP